MFMKNFISFLEYLNESVIDPKNETLDPLIFIEPEKSSFPKINDAVKSQIMLIAEEFKSIVEIDDVWIKGSILTKNYTPRSDIDVTIITHSDGSLDDDKTWDFVKAHSGTFARNTQHPINFFINFVKTIKDIKEILMNFDNVYSVTKDTWVKKTKDYSVDVSKYLDKFKNSIAEIDLNTMQLRRDLIDFNALKKNSKKMNKQLRDNADKALKNIERSIKTMISKADETKKGRLMAFKRPMTIAELKKIKSKNTLPENVIYKLTERYYYFELIKTLDDILDNNKLDNDDVIDIQDALQGFFKKTE